MFLIRSIVLATIGAVGSAHAVHAQPELREGSRVRIEVTDKSRVTGIIRTITSDSLTLIVHSSSAHIGVARASVKSIQISHGRTGATGAMNGAVVGGVIFGVTAGAAAVPYANNNKEVADVATGGLVYGAILGALFGAVLKAEKWTTVPLHASLGATSNSFNVSLRMN